MAEGISPPKRSTTAWAMATRLRAFERKNPVERTSPSTSERSAAARATASGNRANSAGVVRLTRASVHWADKMVATSSWNGSP